MKVFSIGSDIVLARKLNSVKAKETATEQNQPKEQKNDSAATAQGNDQKGEQATRKEEANSQQTVKENAAKEGAKKGK